MCLTLGLNYKEETAEQPITCFKVVMKGKSGGLLLTPYQNMTVKIGKTYTSEIRVGTLCGDSVLTLGFHSFQNLELAKSEAKGWECLKLTIPLVVKCQIPTGAKYYQGGFECSDILALNDCYGSDMIEYLEIVE
jgi:hypothetical protein